MQKAKPGSSDLPHFEHFLGSSVDVSLADRSFVSAIVIPAMPEAGPLALPVVPPIFSGVVDARLPRLVNYPLSRQLILTSQL